MDRASATPPESMSLTVARIMTPRQWEVGEGCHLLAKASMESGACTSEGACLSCRTTGSDGRCVPVSHARRERSTQYRYLSEVWLLRKCACRDTPRSPKELSAFRRRTTQSRAIRVHHFA